VLEGRHVAIFLKKFEVEDEQTSLWIRDKIVARQVQEEQASLAKFLHKGRDRSHSAEGELNLVGSGKLPAHVLASVRVESGQDPVVSVFKELRH
jgi:hypothetical protein